VEWQQLKHRYHAIFGGDCSVLSGIGRPSVHRRGIGPCPPAVSRILYKYDNNLTFSSQKLALFQELRGLLLFYAMGAEAEIGRLLAPIAADFLQSYPHKPWSVRDSDGGTDG
jgi:hypothetical protein